MLLIVLPFQNPWFKPQIQWALPLFVAFATLVVHVCQRLVERTGLTIEPSERRERFAQTALCIGTLVWTLDVAGLFMYADFSAQNARLMLVILALVIIVASARLTIPALSNTMKKIPLIYASLGLALGMLLAHLLVMASLGRWAGAIRWSALGASVLLILSLAGGIAIRHRAVRIKAIRSRFHPLPWPEKILAGCAILLLHICMVNAFPVLPDAPTKSGAGLSMLLIFVLFGLAFSVDQMFRLRAEERHQNLLNRALGLLRSCHPIPDEDENAEYRIASIAECLEDLLAPGAMELQFQPICPIQSLGSGFRFESLLRVRNESLGSLHPELFFLACERAGKTAWADRTILLRALEDSRPWLGSLRKCEGISVNVAPGTLLEPGFVDWLECILLDGVWPTGWLQLEITEHAMISQAGPLAMIVSELSSLGVPVVMDDFGSGFSSLTVLVDLPIRGIKCDMGFVRDLATDRTRQILLYHVCRMGHSLGLEVTVEGIETEVELGIVRKAGAHAVQGYVFAHPMNAASVLPWIKEQVHTQTLAGLVECPI